MLRVELSKTKSVEIRWKHTVYKRPLWVLSRYSQVGIKAHTDCEIIVNTSETDVQRHVAVAQCSVEDEFNRAIGREQSLIYAMRIAGLSKSERKKIWLAMPMIQKRIKRNPIFATGIIG